VPNVIEVAIKQTGANGKSANFTCHGAYSAAPPSLASLASTLWTAISGAWNTDLAPLMAPTAMLTAVWLRDMTNVNNPIVVGTGTNIPGTGTIPALPPDNAVVLTEIVNARGRGLKGRMYLSGFVVAADGGSGTITAAAETAINNFGLALFNALNTNSLIPCVAQVHRQQYQGLTGTIHPDRPASHVTVSQYVVQDTRWDTQRRRGEP